MVTQGRWSLNTTLVYVKCTVEGNKKLRSHNTSYCLREVVTKAGLTVFVLHVELFSLFKK